MGSGNWLKNIINCKPRKLKSKKGFSLKSATNGTEPQFQEKSKTTISNRPTKGVGPIDEGIAATRIQTSFRAFKARRTLRHLKGVMRLQTLTNSDFGKKQTTNTLINLQSWSKIQAQIRARRLCMVEDGGIRRKKLENQLKLETKLHDLEVEWSGGCDTKDEAVARIQQREEAAVKRERAMAYAFSHQWRPNSKSISGHNDSELATANWGWSWTDRWIAAQPWENRVLVDLTPKKVNSPANKARRNSSSPSMKNSPNGKNNLKGRKLSYGAATNNENIKTKMLVTQQQ
ncbi:protein IQ-DOMAIN 9 [Rutidosis leptorrhynchoides]|uniref:protein IQ-DOMAIN 9 n=1 Tax=Rutidosis leptorrhynchoides TaxID=125765 RepID=UPI003A98F08E